MFFKYDRCYTAILSPPRRYFAIIAWVQFKSGTIQSRQNKYTLFSLDVPIHLHILFLQILSATPGLGEAIANDMDISHQYTENFHHNYNIQTELISLDTLQEENKDGSHFGSHCLTM